MCVDIALFLSSFGCTFSFLRKGAEPSAACGRCSDAEHGQSKEKASGSAASTMLCTWSAKLSIIPFNKPPHRQQIQIARQQRRRAGRAHRANGHGAADGPGDERRNDHRRVFEIQGHV